MVTFTVPPGTAGARADKLLAEQAAGVSRTRLKRAFDAGQVTQNGAVIAARKKVGPGDVLRAELLLESFEAAPVARAIPLNIVFEDADIVVVNKAAGMVTHPGSGTGEDTLVHALLYHCKNALSSVGAPLRPGIVHRLDKETSGLLIVAKNDAAHHQLAAAFSSRTLYKRYLALVTGAPARDSGSCKAPIFRHATQRTKMAVTEKGRAAHTDWRVRQRFGHAATLVECVIHTGRTHQIRVHLSHLKHPLLGDHTYGYKANRLPQITVPRVMLHAAELRLKHPLSGEELQFAAPLPEDFNHLMAELADFR